MRSPRRTPGRWLLANDFRELLLSRAFWMLVGVVGLLVGHAFLTATETYAEVSGAAGGTAVLSQGLSPLDGVIVPTFSAYNLAATLLLPFVVIRLVATERQSGALRLLLQASPSRTAIIASKVAVLLVAWIVALTPGAIAMLLWRSAGGHLDTAEVVAVIAGHLALALITIGISVAAGALAGSPASGAIIALTVTLGAWAIDFAATVNGGWAAAMARYTPSAVLRTFEHGELRLATVAISLVIIAFGAGIAAIALDVGEHSRRRVLKMTAAATAAVVVALAFSRTRASRDVSEDRRNSFPPAHERALRAIATPLGLEVHLAAEDPRRVDLEREVLGKLRRVMKVDVRYVGAGSTGMTDRSAHYGEMVYSIGSRADTTRSVIVPVVLETIYRLSNAAAPTEAADASTYPGYPLARVPSGIHMIFFVMWPIIVVAGWLLTRRLL